MPTAALMFNGLLSAVTYFSFECDCFSSETVGPCRRDLPDLPFRRIETGLTPNICSIDRRSTESESELLCACVLFLTTVERRNFIRMGLPGPHDKLISRTTVTISSKCFDSKSISFA